MILSTYHFPHRLCIWNHSENLIFLLVHTIMFGPREDQTTFKIRIAIRRWTWNHVKINKKGATLWAVVFKSQTLVAYLILSLSRSLSLSAPYLIFELIFLQFQICPPVRPEQTTHSGKSLDWHGTEDIHIRTSYAINWID